MTAFEILKYMAWIRGTPRGRIYREVEKWLRRMDLTRYKNIQIKYYSGGTKRKLNTAIAMVITNQLNLFGFFFSRWNFFSVRYMKGKCQGKTKLAF